MSTAPFMLYFIIFKCFCNDQVKCTSNLSSNNTQNQYKEYIIVQQELSDNIYLNKQLQTLDIPIICKQLKAFNFVPTSYIHYFVNGQHYKIKKEKNILTMINQAKMNLENFTNKTYIQSGYYVEFGPQALQNSQIFQLLNQRKLDLNMYYNASLNIPIIIYRDFIPLQLEDKILTDYYELNNSLTKSNIMLVRDIKDPGDLEALLKIYQYIIAIDYYYLDYQSKMLTLYNMSDLMYNKVKNLTLEYESKLQFALIFNQELIRHINPLKQPVLHVFYEKQYYKQFPFKHGSDIFTQFRQHIQQCQKDLLIPDKILSNDQLIRNQALENNFQIKKLLKVAFLSRNFLFLILIIICVSIMTLLRPKYQQIKQKLLQILKKKRDAKQHLQESNLFGNNNYPGLTTSQLYERPSIQQSQYNQQKVQQRLNGSQKNADQSGLRHNRSKLMSNGSFLVNLEVNTSQQSTFSSAFYSDTKKTPRQLRDSNQDLLNTSTQSHRKHNVISKRSFSYLNLNNLSNDSIPKVTASQENLPPIVQKSSTLTDLLTNDSSFLKFKKNTQNLNFVNENEKDGDIYRTENRVSSSQNQKSSQKSTDGTQNAENEAELINFGDSVDSDSCHIQNPLTVGRSKTVGYALHIISEENLIASESSTEKQKQLKEPGKENLQTWQFNLQKEQSDIKHIQTQPLGKFVSNLIGNANARSEISLVRSDKNTDSQDDQNTSTNPNGSGSVRTSCEALNRKSEMVIGQLNQITVQNIDKPDQQQTQAQGRQHGQDGQDNLPNPSTVQRKATINQSGLAALESSFTHPETPHVDGISVPDFVIQNVDTNDEGFQELSDIEADAHIGSTSNNSETFKMSLHDDEL